jgi:hypothetical protein
MVFRTADHAVTGFNLLGIRYRHEVCERWIAEGRSMEYVMAHLAEANFDPEFYYRYEGAIVAKFRELAALKKSVKDTALI